MKWFSIEVIVKGVEVKARVRAESYEQAREKLLKSLNATEGKV